MSTYEYATEAGHFTADTSRAGDSVYVAAQPTNVPLYGMWIPNADAPTVALELLKAAGHTKLAALIESAAREAAEKAEAEATETKLQERREELAKNAGHSVYMYAPQNIKTLIARVVELEEGQVRP